MPVTHSASTNLGCSSRRYHFWRRCEIPHFPIFYVFASHFLWPSSSRHQVIPQGLACQSGLRVGDRILEVNTIDLRHATHQEAVRALLANKQEIRMLVRRDPSPPGMQVRPSTPTNTHDITQEVAHPYLAWRAAYISLQEIVIQKQPGEKLGISIRGGAKGHAGNPFDATDEGIFISKVLYIYFICYNDAIQSFLCIF